MINKPINPAPYNKCISNNSEEILRCDIPNNKLISASYTTISEVSSGETVFSDYKTYDIPQSSIEYMQKFDSLKSGSEYYWNTRYWQNPTTSGNEYSILSDCEKDQDTIFVNMPNLEYVMDAPFLPPSGGNFEVIIYEKATSEELGMITDLYWNYNEYNGDLNSYYFFSKYIHYYVDSPIILYYGENWDGDVVQPICDFYIKMMEIGGDSCFLMLHDENDNAVAGTAIKAFDAGGRGSFNVGGCNLAISLHDQTFGTKLYNIATHKRGYATINEHLNYSISSLNGYSIKLYKVAQNQALPIGGTICLPDKTFYNVVSSTISDKIISLKTEPVIQDNYSAGDILYYYPNGDDYTNVSPDYYFRCKNEPIISITSPIIDGVITDIKGDFGIEYTLNDGDGLAPFNYFQLFFYGLNDEGKWMPIEKSPKLFDKNSTYCFNRFDNNRKYKVCAMCVDNDGDEWVSDEIIFKAEYQVNYDYSINNKYIFFDNECYIVNINLETILMSYSNPIWEVYKIESGAIVVDFAGKNSGLFEYTKFKDYNIRNNVDYTYFVRIEYDGKLDEYSNSNEVSGVEILCIGNIFTDFDGTCIIGLRKNPNGTYEIDGIFNLEYYFENNMSEITQELSRSYIGGFDKFQKELKGSTNYIKGSAVGLLGNNANDEYFEPDKIRDKWLNFVNDDTLKMYKGFDGETILISISSSKIKPRYFNDSGLVNEVSISWQQTGTLENTAIFEVYG